MTILIVRLGAFGDILHSLPAAASLKMSFPEARLLWITRPVWLPLLQGNPFLDEVVPLDTKPVWPCLRRSWRMLGALRPDTAVDVQGLIQSALVARAARPRTLWGFDRQAVREPLASLLYTHRVHVAGPHRVQRNLQLIAAVGAKIISEEAWIPQGAPEGELPDAPFVLASPFAGWAGKQWPLEFYVELGSRLSAEGLQLVLNVSPQQTPLLVGLPNLRAHVSSLSGLIHATRRAVAVVGVDSGPLHLAAALRKPGVAVFGPTDPAATGPYGGTMTVLRTEGVATTYHRDKAIHPSMKAIRPDAVAAALLTCLTVRT